MAQPTGSEDRSLVPEAPSGGGLRDETSIGPRTDQPAGAATEPADAEPGRPIEPAGPTGTEPGAGPAGPAPVAALDGGRFTMGTAGPMAQPADGEHILHEVGVGPFELGVHAVSNARFAEFVEATGHVTDAERIGWAFVFGGLLPDDFPETRGVAAAPWWRQVFGAGWAHPEGPHSSIDDRLDHPVVQVSHADALAFCSWEGSRLPTEAEWEYAARGGRAGCVFPWGDEREPDGVHRMNVWQGSFPDARTPDDGWYGTAPVDAFEPNDFGLYNMCGNVWEWCADWFSPDYYRHSPVDDPPGPAEPGPGDHLSGHRVIRGGSYLCHHSYCNRYRVGARSSNALDAATGNLGFRTAHHRHQVRVGPSNDEQARTTGGPDDRPERGLRRDHHP